MKDIIIGVVFVGFVIIYFITLYFMNRIIDRKEEKIKELEFALSAMVA